MRLVGIICNNKYTTLTKLAQVWMFSVKTVLILQKGWASTKKKLVTLEKRYKIRNVDNSEQGSDDSLIAVEKLLFWSFQIANGMEFLGFRKVLHGDLAARNCLLGNKNIVKICDFGLSRALHRNYDYEYKKGVKNALLPLKWMAIESMKRGIVSSKSDSWSFGVLLWEIFSLGDTPYAGLLVGRKFVDEVSNGYRLNCPVLSPPPVYCILQQCWNADPYKRPTFPALVLRLGRMLKEDVCELYFKQCADYQRRFEKNTEEGLLTVYPELLDNNSGLYSKVYNKNTEPEHKADDRLL